MELAEDISHAPRAVTTTFVSILLALGVIVLAPAPGEAARRPSCRSTQLIAHRGMADRRHVENTIRTFNRAYARGVSSLETDVRLTADGQWVLMHDVRVDRTTNGAGAVSDLSLAQVKALRTNDGVVGGVPTLGQTLWLVAHRSRMRLQIEVKTTDADEAAMRRLTTLISDYGVVRRISITSYSSDALVLLRTLMPSLSTGIVTLGQLSTETVRQTGGRVVIEHHSLSRAYVQLMHTAHFQVSVWTVNRKPQWRRAVLAGADTIITNSPPRMRKYCGRR